MTVHYLGDPMFRAFDANGEPLAGGKLHTFEEGSSTPKGSFTDGTGLVTAANPVILDSSGRAEVWLSGKYKLRLDNSLDVVQWTMDAVAGVGFVDAAAIIDEWTPFTDGDPTFIDATHFSVAGDKRSTFQVGRRVRATVTAGLVYGRITANPFTTLTTLTVLWDAAEALDAGLTAVAVGWLSVDKKSTNWRAIDGLELDFSKKGLNDSFVAGTVMLFNQTVPPVGWTKNTTHNNRGLRLTSGAVGIGGTIPFDTVFSDNSGATDGHVLTIAEMPSHTHNYLGIVAGAPDSGGGGFFGQFVPTTAVGGDAAHAHDFGLDLSLEYVDVILATKD